MLPTTDSPTTEIKFQGIPYKQIEDVLGKTSSWNGWKDNIKNRYDNATEDNLDALFAYWD